MSILAGLLKGLTGKAAGTLAGGAGDAAAGLFSSIIGGGENEDSGLIDKALNGIKATGNAAALTKTGLGIAGDVMNANTMGDMLSLGRENGFRTNEFLARNTDVLGSLKQSSGIDAQMLSNSQQGGFRGFGANVKLRNAYNEVEKRYKDIAPYLGAAEGNEIGNRIANSTPEYQSPAYGKQGMKFQPRSKFSYQTKKI